jgi:hypothetical protein
MRPIGRRKGYTAIGISRVPCLGCGKPSSHQWSICALDNRWFGVCTECDIGLNAIVLRFFRFPSTVLAHYAQRRRSEAS